MASLNKVMLIGNVTRDPEIKYTPKGSAVADLGLAINRSYTNQGGEKVEETTYVDVELWGRLAEIAGEYAKKGRPIFIEGRLRIDSWEDKQSGQKRSRLKVVGEGLQLLGSGTRLGGQGGGGGEYEMDAPPTPQRRPAAPPPQRQGPPKPAPLDAEDDDIPF
ncbi:MAG: single-stranded DNA-binding protein [Verrucomicrobia bacterium 61-8]|nr:single-stranded DNA-binding protein [Verrucomicrobiota bacterium]OJV19789.1 MAG: single-stranded DNA-binding protein [Verrucomicrobia bacterium 61-8]